MLRVMLLGICFFFQQLWHILLFGLSLLLYFVLCYSIRARNIIQRKWNQIRNNINNNKIYNPQSENENVKPSQKIFTNIERIH